MERLGAPVEATQNFPELSPDGQRVAFFSLLKGKNEILLMDVARGAPTPLTSEPGNNVNPMWSPDGARVLFESFQGNDAALLTKFPDAPPDERGQLLAVAC